MKQLGTPETIEQTKINDKKFSDILDELRNLGLFEITCKLAEVYYQNSSNQFYAGLCEAKKIYKK